MTMRLVVRLQDRSPHCRAPLARVLPALVLPIVRTISGGRLAGVDPAGHAPLGERRAGAQVIDVARGDEAGCFVERTCTVIDLGDPELQLVVAPVGAPSPRRLGSARGRRRDRALRAPPTSRRDRRATSRRARNHRRCRRGRRRERRRTSPPGCPRHGGERAPPSRRQIVAPLPRAYCSNASGASASARRRRSASSSPSSGVMRRMVTSMLHSWTEREAGAGGFARGSARGTRPGRRGRGHPRGTPAVARAHRGDAGGLLREAHALPPLPRVGDPRVSTCGTARTGASASSCPSAACPRPPARSSCAR